MNKKIKYFAIVFLITIIIVGILLNNRSQMKAESQLETNDLFYVTVQEVKKIKPVEELRIVGNFYPNNDVMIISETQGRVTEVLASVGDFVQAGTVLAKVDDVLQKANYNLASINLEKSKKDFERAKILFEQKTIPESQFDMAKLGLSQAELNYAAAKQQLDNTKITSPISGYVVLRNINVGSYLQAGPTATLVANVVDISRLKVQVNVSEHDVFKLKLRDKVEVTSDIYPGVIFEGEIESISKKGDNAHTYPIEISVRNNPKNPLKAGMFARINFVSINKDEVIAIPRKSLIGSIRQPQVFVVENNIARLKNIVVGNQFENSIEVISGLAVGENVVTNGQNMLSDNVKVVIQK